MLSDIQIAEIKAQMDFERKRKGPPAGFPKFPDIPAGRYNSEEFYALENRFFWRKTWMLAAFLDEIPNPGDYKLWEQARQPVLILHGKDGVVRSFYNTCAHRGAPVVFEQYGHAEHGVACKYHGWTYDHEGKLIGLRDKRDFVDLDTSCRGLKEIRTERYGKMIFVNFDENAVPLKDYLGDVWDEWKEFRFDTLRLVDRYEWNLHCNWKIGMDANMEVYHVKSIHPQTVDLGLDSRANVNTLYPGGHSRMVAPGREDTEMPSPPEHLPSNPEVGEIGRTCTQSYHIEPNFISPMGPGIFPLLQFWPTSLKTAVYEIYWVGPDWGDGPVPKEWRDYIDYFNQVITEDTEFGDWIQKSVDSYGFEGVPLSYQEARIYHAHQNMDAVIGLQNIPDHLRVAPVLSQDWMHPNDTRNRLEQYQALSQNAAE